ncbi:MAG: YdcF family protein [Bacteroidia bacterium]
MWEIRAYSSNKINQAYDVGIVMGGASRYYNPETKRLVYGNGIDRVMQAVELYQQKKIKKILLTGGSGYVLLQQIKEADLLKKMLVNMHIPDSDVIEERQSRNTFENAKMSADILKSNLYGKRYLIITSAFHIRRTLACFNKQGISADVFPVDEHANGNSYTPDKLIVPDTGSLSNWEILFHEWTGMLIYKFAGYI